jgi:hypothetical protein
VLTQLALLRQWNFKANLAFVKARSLSPPSFSVSGKRELSTFAGLANGRQYLFGYIPTSERYIFIPLLERGSARDSVFHSLMLAGRSTIEKRYVR